MPARVRIIACLKRDGYGCGAARVARALMEEGADGFAVGALPDAIAIRRMGVDLPVLLYPGPLPTAAETIESLRLTVSVSSIEELERWRSATSVVRVFVKVDLGFFRAGATPQEVGRLLAAARHHSDVEVEGLYAHLSELPTSGSASASEQFIRLRAIVKEAEASGTRPPIVMLSSTEGVLSYPEMDLDAVDPGALFVGIAEANQPARSVTLQPALRAISTSLVSIKRVDASLGPEPAIPGFRPGMVIGVLGFGWGDGLPRHLPSQAEALVRGHRVRLLPPTHLEHVRVDLTDVPQARFGDQALLLGKQGDHTITLDEVAAQWGTDVIGLYAQLRDHIPRIYG